MNRICVRAAVLAAICALSTVGYGGTLSSAEAATTSRPSTPGMVPHPPGQTMPEFLDFVVRDVDQYWVDVFAQAGRPEPTVSYRWPQPGERLPSQCGANGYTDDNSAFYCVFDDEIVISQDFARRIEQGAVKANNDPATGKASGDFSVAYAVAHEYAHSLQAELGLIRPDGSTLHSVLQTELHADCWAGVWASSADKQGQLEPGDLEEAIQTATLIGDYLDSDPRHHGTPRQRVGAFTTGYQRGLPEACEPLLTG